MYNSQFVSLLYEREEELKDDIARIKVSGDKNRATKLYNKNRERKIVHLVGQLVNQLVKVAPDAIQSLDNMSKETLTYLSTLEDERPRYPKIEVHAGDKMTELMDKYDRKDIYRKLRVAVAEAGLHINKETGIIEEGAEEVSYE